jgi:D-xylose transport system permease protein
MSTGMVLLIVMRQLDLSVGSMLSLIAVAGAVLQVFNLAPTLGVGHPAIWVISVIFIIALGASIGAFNGWLTAYAQIPAFIVTLGGLIAYKGIAFAIARGETVAPMDKAFQIFGGNVPESWLGQNLSWAIALITCAGIIYAIVNGRRQRQRFKFPLRPMWAEYFLAILGSTVVLIITYVMNSYPWPYRLAQSYAKANGVTLPVGVENKDGDAICMAADQVVRCIEGYIIPTGYSVPVVVALVVGFAMSFITTRTAFGRYVFAIGGNPEAAELSGIDTKKMIVKVFALMGVLVAISAIISSARLNAATNGLGLSNELYVIAATVIGGTSLAGGVGTIYGAMVGALMMQSIVSGMNLLNLPAAMQDIVVGSVLVFAVWLDQVYTRRVK